MRYETIVVKKVITTTEPKSVQIFDTGDVLEVTKNSEQFYIGDKILIKDSRTINNNSSYDEYVYYSVLIYCSKKKTFTSGEMYGSFFDTRIKVNYLFNMLKKDNHLNTFS